MKNTLKKLAGSKFGRRYIGDRAFYMAVLSIVIPVVIQNSISNFVSLLDNLMVAAVSTNQMNGVSIANQLVFVFNLCIFGGVAGPGIFSAQFFGAGDHKGVRDSFRYSMVIAAVVSAAAIIIFALFRTPIAATYINNPASQEAADEMLQVASDYLLIMMLGLIPFAVSQAYASILRSCGETKIPMFAAISGVLVNLCLNAILIFGLFGFPEMKAKGAAVATVISRYVEMLIVVILAHVRSAKYPSNDAYRFLAGAYRHFTIPMTLVRKITVKGMPLLLNEAAWSMGMAMLSQLYSRLGTDVVAAQTINSTLANLFNVFFISMGTAASVMVGQPLGMSDFDGAKRNVRRIMFFQMCICFTFGTIMFIVSPLLPYCFKEADEAIRIIATGMLCVTACAMPVNGFAHCSYFILRSGGRTIITFLFDSAYTWLIPIPLVYSLVTFTNLPILSVFICCHVADLIKVALGAVLLKKGVWIRNIVSASE
ncbi:MAG: MATE family efflux transporter [Clostridia bacterium]|nr:MATE family efflux transporter [Clostridia bacterium]